MDPTWNEMEINPTHISFRGLHADLKVIHVMGRVKLRLVSVKRK